MLRVRYVAVVGDLADFPKPLHVLLRFGEVAGGRVTGQGFQRQKVGIGLGTGEALLLRQHVERLLEPFQRAEVELAVAPLQHAHGIEIVALEALHHLGLEGIGLAGHAEGAVIHVAAGTARHLAEFRRIELAILKAVEFARRGEGHMVHIHVKAHAHGIGGHDVIDVTRLIQCHLRIAGAWAECPKHHGGTAVLAANEFCRGIDHVGREGDDGRAAGQARELLLASVEQLRESRARDEGDAWQQLLEYGAHGARTQQHRLVTAAAVDDAVGEDVAALEVSAELHLVDGEEGHLDVGWHRLDGADPVARLDGNDLFLTRHQRHGGIACAGPHLVINLTRKKPEREADHAAAVPQHALHREVGLAGVGGAKHGSDGFLGGHPVRLREILGAQTWGACPGGSRSFDPF